MSKVEKNWGLTFGSGGGGRERVNRMRILKNRSDEKLAVVGRNSGGGWFRTGRKKKPDSGGT